MGALPHTAVDGDGGRATADGKAGRAPLVVREVVVGLKYRGTTGTRSTFVITRRQATRTDYCNDGGCE